MKMYTVYFEQVNTQYVEVMASSEAAAISKAKKVWVENNPPEVQDIEQGTIHEADEDRVRIKTRA